MSIYNTNQIYTNVIYKITNLINGKDYIGMHQCKGICFIGIGCKYLGSGSLIKKAITKYGRKNFKKEILCQFKDILREDLGNLEKEYITKNKEIGKSEYNLADGGLNAYTLRYATPEFKKLSTPDNQGTKNPMYGKKHTNQTKEHISDVKKSGKLHAGDKNGRATKILCFDLNKTYMQTFNTIVDAVAFVQLTFPSAHRKSLRRCLQGKTTKYYNYIFEYEKPFDKEENLKERETRIKNNKQKNLKRQCKAVLLYNEQTKEELKFNSVLETHNYIKQVFNKNLRIPLYCRDQSLIYEGFKFKYI